MENIRTEILIVGSGPAGLTAALYAARAGRSTVVLESERAPSRLSIGYELENYPGFLSIDSSVLLAKFREQAGRFGARFVRGDAVSFSLQGSPKFVSTSGAFLEAEAVILALGKPFARERLIPGEERLLGYGVSYCAVCDGPLYKGREAAAFGHSGEAVEDVLALHQMGVNVHWITGRMKDAAALEAAMTRVEKLGIPAYAQAEIKEIGGERSVEQVVFKTMTGEHSLPVRGVFIFREVPTGPLLSKAGLDLDHKQCLSVDRRQRTNLEGVFAAGDMTCGGLQVVSAAGEGCVAALQAIAYLRR
ncbi:MAG: FAD-binding protein [Candidatus Aminicenantes bacterium]|nr:FAD-binding protein [Candidatus Aminicenantes bacterium]